MILALLFAAVVGAIIGGFLGWRARGAADAIRIEELKEFGNLWRDIARERQAVVDKMRQDGFQIQKAAKINESPDPESEGLARAEANLIQRRADAHFIQNAKQDILRKNPGTSERAALAEAVRLRNEVMMEDPPT